MPTFERKTMCDECPFRKKSLPGWLGPHSIDDIEKVVQSDEPFICHKSIAEMIESGIPEGDPQLEEEGEHCVGMLRYRNAMCKRSRDPETAQAQTEIRSVDDVPVIEARKFREHHEKLPSLQEGIVMKPIRKDGFVKHKPRKPKKD